MQMFVYKNDPLDSQKTKKMFSMQNVYRHVKTISHLIHKTVRKKQFQISLQSVTI